MRTVRMISAAAAVAIAMAVAVPGLASAGTNTVLVNDSSSTFEVRPSLIGYTGDATGYVGRRTWGGKRGYMRWKTWNIYSAYGVGTVWLNTCNPSCADGGWRSRKGWVQLSVPKNGRFTDMTITYRRGDRMVSDHRTSRWLPRNGPYSGGYWIWS